VIRYVAFSNVATDDSCQLPVASTTKTLMQKLLWCWLNVKTC